ncbi:MAG: HNH endonuclease [Bacteroidetes bacterium]|nr:MAG: HNH endonuclease [Bacteroidota bacterium]
MSGRLKKNSVELYRDLKLIISNFEEYLERKELRPKVLEMVKILHLYRDLGISLVDNERNLSARNRILKYLKGYVGHLINGDELLVISGTQEYARRIRELRVDFGWPIISGVTLKQMILDGELDGFDLNTVKPDTYILLKDEQDLESAYRYNLMKDIRKSESLSARDKILTFLRSNIGKQVTGEELSYVSKISDWPRRIRELRTEYGWPVMTKSTGRPDLPVGYYVLAEDRQDEEHDRHIRNEDRIKVLDRDYCRCVICNWPINSSVHDKFRNRLELHHIVNHVKKGKNSADNLVTLCNVHHDLIHKVDKNGRMTVLEFYEWVELEKENYK